MDVAALSGLLLEVGAGLLLLASATLCVLLLWVPWPRRALRVHAARWARSPWTGTDAILVVGASFALLAGYLLPAWNGTPVGGAEAPTPGALWFSAAVLPLFVALLCLYRAFVAGVPVGTLLGVRARGWMRAAAMGVCGGVGLLLPVLALSWLSALGLQAVGIGPEMQDALRWFQSPDTPWSVRLAILVQGVVFAPIVEEVLYRRVLLGVVRRTLHTVPAVLLVSLFFAALHLDAHVLVPLVLVGASLAWMQFATGSLVAAVAMHMVFNAGNLFLAVAAG